MTLTDATHAGLPCVASFIVLLGLLTCDPFTDIGGTVSELDSIGFGGRHERHCIAIDQKNVLEIDGGDGATLLCEDASEYVQILHGNPTADDQDHAIVISHQTVDSAAHFGGVFSLSRKRKPDATCSRENTAKTGCGAECDVVMPGESGESGYCGDSGGDSGDSNDGVSRNLNCLLLIARALICDGPTLQFFKRPTRILHQLLIDELDVPIGRRTENKAGNQIEIVRRDSCLSAQVGKCV